MSLLEPSFIPREAIAALRPRIDETRCRGLYASGAIDVFAAPAVAIVGSRAPSEHGRRLARHTAAALASSGVCIISGLALGIDAAAHEGALDAASPTVGVLGSGHRAFFPKRNITLAERIIERGGAVVSPFDPDWPAYPSQFLQRNAIIAALADAVVVVEAAERSGSLNTASWASDLGLPVFAFPGDVERPKVAGCLALIRDGATLVRHAGDILEGLGLTARPITPEQCAPVPAGDDGLVFHALRGGSDGVDALAAATGLAPAAINAALVRLEFAGLLNSAG